MFLTALRPSSRHVIVVRVFDYRLIDSAGSEIGIVKDERPRITEGDTVTLLDGSTAEVLDVYDDEYGQEGGVVATLALDVE
jgi:hypothetical protein